MLWFIVGLVVGLASSALTLSSYFESRRSGTREMIRHLKEERDHYLELYRNAGLKKQH